MSERIALLSKESRTFWFLLPNEEMANEIYNNPEIQTELKKAIECVNFQWDPTKVKLEDIDLAFVCVPVNASPEWQHFTWDVAWHNPHVYMIYERDFRMHMPPNGNDGIQRICQVINLQRSRYPLQQEQ